MRIFLAGSLPHKFIILIVTSFICLWSINFSLSAKFDRGHPLRGRQMLVGRVKIGDFGQVTGYI